MIAADVIAALALPADSLVNQRVPKKLLVENGAPTPGDKRQISEGIEELLWIAALKPNTIGVPEYRDASHEVVEIAVLSLTLRPVARTERLVELIHRAIPYPVFLISEQANVMVLSLARKRLAQNEAGRVVLEEAPIMCSLDATLCANEWLVKLTLAALPRTHLLALYEGWIAALEALQAGTITGKVVLPADSEAQASRHQALADHARLQRNIAVLRARAQKEKQVNRRVDLNLEIKRLEVELCRIASGL